ncbi:MAG: hypothetical protein ACHQYR_01210 [Candidatus Gagatemarchaeaceae archaeon]
MAEGPLTEEDCKTLGLILGQRHGKVKVIPVASNPRAIIVKTDNSVAPILRESSGQIRLSGMTLVTVLTSGSIGKLKRRASGPGTTGNGKVP